MKFGLQKTLNQKIARRYAKALFRLAQEAHQVDEVYADIVFLSETLLSSADLKQFIENPKVEPKLCFSVFKELFDGRITPVVLKYLNFLSQKHRLNILPEILSSFEFLFHQNKQIRSIEIISAFALDSRQIDEICKKLKAKWQKTIFAKVSVNQELIGGFQIKVGDQIFDYSLRNQLDRFLRQAIKG